MYQCQRELMELLLRFEDASEKKSLINSPRFT